MASAIALVLAIVYTANGEVLPVHDADPNVYLAANMIEEGRLSFAPSRDPWLFEWEARTREGVRHVDFATLRAALKDRPIVELLRGGAVRPVPIYAFAASVRSDPVTGEPVYVGLYGPGAGLSAIPALVIVRAFAGDLRRSPEALWYGAKLAASLLVALSAALVYLTARRWVPRGTAVVLALAYGLGTSAWSASSQTLWQHAPTSFFLALGIFFLVRHSAHDGALAGLSFAAASACRPTSVAFAVAAGGYLFVVHRRASVAFVLASLPVAIGLGAYNAYFLGSPLKFGQSGAVAEVARRITGSPDPWQTPLLEGLAGLLVSPSRGLLVFSPFLVLGFAGAVLAWRRAEYAPLRPLSIAVVVVLAIQAKWFAWWGGDSYGYRIIVDLALPLVVLIIPVAGWVLGTRPRQLAFAALFGWSVLVQSVGVFAYDSTGWNHRRSDGVALDVNQPEHRHRLWSLSDNQISYYLRHFSEARAAKARSSQAWIERW